jgi:hypothetical protein
MHELTGVLSNNIRFTEEGKAVITFELNERMAALEMVDELYGKEKLSVKVDQHKEKRSLNANNYAWKLITEIGNRTRQSKEEVYLLMLKRYGQSEMVSVLANVPFGKFVKYFDEVGESELKGKLFKHYRVYQGSSEFDTKEMSIFIDGIVSEAKDLGIPTDTPEQIARMKDLWGA